MPEIGREAPAPEITAKETAALAHKGKAALHEIGNNGLESPTPFDIPAPGDVVVSFDKINEIVSRKHRLPLKNRERKNQAPAIKKAQPEKLGPGKENEPKTADSKPKSCHVSVYIHRPCLPFSVSPVFALCVFIL